MSDQPNQKIDLAQVVPNAVGMLAFDENDNVIEASGLGKDRVTDIAQLKLVELDSEGFGLLQVENVQIIILKQEGKMIAVYTYIKP
ncbi:LAFE_0C01178g1_1 [Lachancea fermentati]|uniref:LAFE_0C01178g1_1 n=1 Tax=Lachancea fermentati TaxID=4955 RepID=A0A1G4M8V4_LACFM|nr:LAFE_0C01178g1_1 [Lachancea fermentati]